MKIVLSWLKEFFPEGVLDNYSTSELADTLTSLGLVVESVDLFGPKLDGIVVAKIINLREHPDADNIKLADVDAGTKFNEGAETIQICCGAPNIKVGDFVPLATIGTTMPSGMTISKRKMRGQDSNGMLCSADELELPGGDSDGLYILDQSQADIGKPLSDALNVEQEVVFDLDIEGNRPDALSVAGVARDLAAKLNLEFIQRVPKVSEDTSSNISSEASINNTLPELCPRFGLRIIKDIKVQPTPDWMSRRLEAAGMRAIDPIVDISNYVMLELGQPNHTYDLGLVSGSQLGVRLAKSGETIVTLDDISRQLSDEDIVIVDGQDAVIGIAGIMGGASTEINKMTDSIILECAVWDSSHIAKSSRRLGLRSEASVRFERGVDYDGINRALDRFCELLQEQSNANVISGSLISDGQINQTKFVNVSLQRINMYLASELDFNEVSSILEPIGFRCDDKGDGQLEVQVPSWRPDSSIEADIIEEIARLRGYDEIPSRVPRPKQVGHLSEDQKNMRKIRNSVISMGLSEAMPLPFLSEIDLKNAEVGISGINVTNPLVADESILRSSLLPGLLKSISYNQSHRIENIQLFELGAVFTDSINNQSYEGIPDEKLKLALIGSGFSNNGDAVTQAVNWLNSLFKALKISVFRIKNESVDSLHPSRSAVIQLRGKIIGEIGEIDPEILTKFGVIGRVSWLDLEIRPILDAMKSQVKYQEVSRYPSSDIDLAFNVPNNIQASDIEGVIRSATKDLLVDVHLFDVFTSDQLDSNSRSLTYSLRLQASDRTLTDNEISQIRQKCIDQVKSKYNADFRTS